MAWPAPSRSPAAGKPEHVQDPGPVDAVVIARHGVPRERTAGQPGFAPAREGIQAGIHHQQRVDGEMSRQGGRVARLVDMLLAGWVESWILTMFARGIAALLQPPRHASANVAMKTPHPCC